MMTERGSYESGRPPSARARSDILGWIALSHVFLALVGALFLWWVFEDPLPKGNEGIELLAILNCILFSALVDLWALALALAGLYVRMRRGVSPNLSLLAIGMSLLSLLVLGLIFIFEL